MAQRTRSYHTIRSFLLGLARMLCGHCLGVFGISRQNRKTTTFALTAEVSKFRTHCSNEVFEIAFAACVFLCGSYHFRRTAQEPSIERRYFKPSQWTLNFRFKLVYPI